MLAASKEKTNFIICIGGVVIGLLREEGIVLIEENIIFCFLGSIRIVEIANKLVMYKKLRYR
jgi:hypothetical protein